MGIKKLKDMNNILKKLRGIKKTAQIVQFNNPSASSDNSNIRQLQSQVVQLYPTQRA